ncbi:DMT family transporter [Paenibacillus physcomitrellae]|uniref:Membrane protein n=1 Tax=Paenibacillus physcomitrellae TaxID=1619311 RepID=A0ABQ1FWQ1_9BACL|nr:DMT family transporter [Paenibacillus physcomitrellae]GGA30058.1 membrane protein [Paenibacillus physcomitrellae]
MKGIFKGSLFAFMGGACITLQGVANAQIGKDIGTWQAAAVTQMTGFLMAFLIFLLISGRNLPKLNTSGIRAVKPLYLIGGAFGAIVIFSEVTAIQQIGVTLMISALLIAQLCLAFLIDSFGWFGVAKQKMKLPQFVGIGMMIAGVIILKAL